MHIESVDHTTTTNPKKTNTTTILTKKSAKSTFIPFRFPLHSGHVHPQIHHKHRQNYHHHLYTTSHQKQSKLLRKLTNSVIFYLHQYPPQHHSYHYLNFYHKIISLISYSHVETHCSILLTGKAISFFLFFYFLFFVTYLWNIVSSNIKRRRRISYVVCFTLPLGYRGPGPPGPISQGKRASLTGVSSAADSPFSILLSPNNIYCLSHSP